MSYTPSLEINWEDLASITILADREEELGNPVVEVLRYIYVRKLVPTLANTHVYNPTRIDQIDVVSAYVWYFTDEAFTREDATPTFLPLLFRPYMDHTLEDLAYYEEESTNDPPWRAYVTKEEAYMSIINAYLNNKAIRVYVDTFNILPLRYER